VAEGQSVIDTGPYAVVRHPMYTGAILMMLATPLALGSYLALVFAVALVAGIVARIFAEERFLVQGLAGYPEYRSRVRWRLLPGVW
jgi:protein-S-isoprenylcysteine O-methyltransferase Ste14